jgi:hypothetical protein
LNVEAFELAGAVSSVQRYSTWEKSRSRDTRETSASPSACREEKVAAICYRCNAIERDSPH